MLDVAWAVSMKYAEDYTRLGWSVVSVLLLAAFVHLLGKVLGGLPVGTAYPVWAGDRGCRRVHLGAVWRDT